VSFTSSAMHRLVSPKVAEPFTGVHLRAVDDLLLDLGRKRAEVGAEAADADGQVRVTFRMCFGFAQYPGIDHILTVARAATTPIRRGSAGAIRSERNGTLRTSSPCFSCWSLNITP